MKKSVALVLVLVVLLAYMLICSDAFHCKSKWHHNSQYCHSSIGRSTSIRRSTDASTVTPTPTPKVPSSAWKWPQGWPFTPDFFEVVANLNTDTTEASRVKDDVQVQLYNKHFQYFISENDHILEIIGLKQEVVTTGNKSIRKSSLALSDIAIDADSSCIFPYESESFDSIVFSSSIDTLPAPRDVFREVWRVLKPNGKCMVCFTTKPDGDRPVKMWTTMTDEQKVWIVGSYFYYSAGTGWYGIEGYDISGASGGADTMKFEGNNATTSTDAALLLPAYVVQATKINYNLPTSQDFDAVDYINKQFLAVKHLEEDDKKFNALRLSTDYTRAETAEDKKKVLQLIDKMSSIYEVLRDIKEVIIPSPIKAMFTSLIIERWTNSPEQRQAIRLAFSLDTPTEYWIEVGKYTGLLSPREKIIFLGNIITLFGVSDKVSMLPTLLEEGSAIVKERYSDIDDASIQSFIADYMVNDYLYADSSDSDRVLKFLRVGNSIKDLVYEYKASNRELK